MFRYCGRAQFDPTALFVLFLSEFAFIAIVFNILVIILDVEEGYNQAGYVALTIAYGCLNIGIYLLVLEMHRVKIVVNALSLKSYKRNLFLHKITKWVILTIHVTRVSLLAFNNYLAYEDNLSDFTI
jgi:hypothetical protein